MRSETKDIGIADRPEPPQIAPMQSFHSRRRVQDRAILTAFDIQHPVVVPPWTFNIQDAHRAEQGV
ncbi:MAG: hypothetical protein ABIL62_11060 [Planctomycetota bacterium]